MKRLSPVSERVLSAVALVGTFIVTASIIQPHLTSASRWSSSSQLPVPDVMAEDTILQNEPIGIEDSPTQPLRNLGELIGRSYVVRIYMYGDTPLYSVFTLDGSVVAEMVREVEMKQIVDDTDLRSSIAGFIDENTTLLSAESTTELNGE